MIIPVRCFSCGKVIAGLYESYIKMVKEGKSISEIFRILGLNRNCCRNSISNSIELD